jgi:hypothetical protein
MRKILGVVLGSILSFAILGLNGCGREDKSAKPGFQKENINPSNVKMGTSKDLKGPAPAEKAK